MCKSKKIEQQHQRASGYVLWINNRRVPDWNWALHIVLFSSMFFLENILSSSLSSTGGSNQVVALATTDSLVNVAMA